MAQQQSLSSVTTSDRPTPPSPQPSHNSWRVATTPRGSTGERSSRQSPSSSSSSSSFPTTTSNSFSQLNSPQSPRPLRVSNTCLLTAATTTSSTSLQKCGVCGKEIAMDDTRVLNAEGTPLHCSCFVCTSCHKPLSPQDCGTDLNGLYFCSMHLNSCKPSSLEYQALKMGWLAKQGGFVRNWRRRFFVLVQDELRYFSTKQQALSSTTQPKGVIDLNTVNSISSSFLFVPQTKDISLGGSLPGFQLVTDGRMWNLVCENETEREQWVEAIKMACHLK